MTGMQLFVALAHRARRARNSGPWQKEARGLRAIGQAKALRGGAGGGRRVHGNAGCETGRGRHDGGPGARCPYFAAAQSLPQLTSATSGTESFTTPSIVSFTTRLSSSSSPSGTSKSSSS